jgi:hypothetical protein
MNGYEVYNSRVLKWLFICSSVFDVFGGGIHRKYVPRRT